MAVASAIESQGRQPAPLRIGKVLATLKQERRKARNEIWVIIFDPEAVYRPHSQPVAPIMLQEYLNSGSFGVVIQPHTGRTVATDSKFTFAARRPMGVKVDIECEEEQCSDIAKTTR